MLESATAVDALGARQRDPVWIGLARQHRVFAQFRRGQLALMVETARQVRTFYESFGDMVGAKDAASFVPQSLADMGQLELAEETARWILDERTTKNNPLTTIQGCGQMSYVALLRGRCSEALEVARRGALVVERHNLRAAETGQLGGFYLLALAAVAAGTPDVGKPPRGELRRAIAHALYAVVHCAAFRAFNLWALGRMAAQLGHARLATCLWRRAERSAARHKIPLDLARAQRELGWARLERDPDDAAGLGYLIRALAGLEQCSARPERDALVRRLQSSGLGWVLGTTGASPAGSLSQGSAAEEPRITQRVPR
jgi:hypothetical protein